MSGSRCPSCDNNENGMARRHLHHQRPSRRASATPEPGQTEVAPTTFPVPGLLWRVEGHGLRVEVLVDDERPPSRSLRHWSALRFHDLWPGHGGRVLTRLVRRAITTAETQTGEVDIEVGGRRSSVRVQVVPRYRHSASNFKGDTSDTECTEQEAHHPHPWPGELIESLQFAREEERARIAREIHDELGQSLTALKFDLARLRTHVNDDPRRLKGELADATRSVDALIRLVQDISTELHPALLDSLGLSAAVKWHVDKFSERTGIDCTCTVRDETSNISSCAAAALFRILQESLTNVARHAHADHAWITLAEDSRWATLEVLDDGRGIELLKTCQPFSLGVLGMQERAESLGGEAVVSPRPTGGVRVWVRIPVH